MQKIEGNEKNLKQLLMNTKYTSAGMCGRESMLLS